MNRAGCRLPLQWRRLHSSSNHKTPANYQGKLKHLLREVSQPVAVVTSKSASGSIGIHGATVSSLSSIAMDPYPLLAFALRLPSRLATSLKSQSHQHAVINYLSSTQAQLAYEFSRGDLFPNPFTTNPYHLNEHGIPVLEGCLGAVSCSVLSPGLPLHDLEFLEGHKRREDVADVQSSPNAVISELFIVQATGVEEFQGASGDDEALPLLYQNRQYWTLNSRSFPITPPTR